MTGTFDILASPRRTTNASIWTIHTRGSMLYLHSSQLTVPAPLTTLCMSLPLAIVFIDDHDGD